MSDIYQGPEGLGRCKWSASAPDFLDYHDCEWGFPVDNDYRLFEKISLEGFQSGLSWRTILSKRENFREAFSDFNFHKVSEFDGSVVDSLLGNKGIIRHRGKIEAVLNNAKRAKELEREFGSLAAYFWAYEPKSLEQPPPQTRSTSPESVAMSKDLKKRGWKFVGPTTVYAFMQAMGLVNDHSLGCFIREKVEIARKEFVRPLLY